MLRLLCAYAVLACSIAWAQDAGSPPVNAAPPPPADEIKRVLDYYYNGKDRGPALIELKPCLKIDGDKKSATKFECLEPVEKPVKKGTVVHAWSTWYLPEGSKYDDCSIQYLHEGQVRSTIDIALDTPGRTRIWRSSALSKPGKWTIKIMRGDKELGQVNVTVASE